MMGVTRVMGLLGVTRVMALLGMTVVASSDGWQQCIIVITIGY